MTSRLAEAHITAQDRLRRLVSGHVGTAWSRLGSYDRRDIPRFLALTTPVIVAGRAQSVALTEAYIALALDRPPLGVSPTIRNGASIEEVYSRPFVTVWTSLQNGSPWDQAVGAGLERSTSTAEMDMQLSSRATFGEVGREDEGIYGYQRVADGGACEFCQEVDGAYVKDGDAMPLHNRCGCTLEPLDSPHENARFLPDGSEAYEHGGAQVEPHGELGPLLTDPAHQFTGEPQLA